MAIAIGIATSFSRGGGQSWESYFLTRTPSNLVATVISESQIDLAWDDAAEAADGLKIYLSTDGGANYTYNSTVAFGVEGKSLTGLTHNTDYTIKLVAYSGANESNPIIDSEKTIEAWYLAGGVAAVNCKGAYQPIGAASLAASKVNRINPGTNDAGGGTDPTHDPALGWIFNGSSQYLKTGIVPENDQTWSMIIKYSEYTTGDDQIAGLYEDANKQFGLLAANSGSYERIIGRNGNNSGYKKQQADAGVIAVCGTKMYWNGNEIAAPYVNYPLTAGSGAISYDIWIGCTHYTTAVDFFDGNIQALAIYDKVLSADEVLAITTKMNNISETDRVLRENYVNQKFGALVCYGIPTFTEDEDIQDLADEPINTFAPTGLDIDNWLDACVAAGMKYAILTAKTTSGFKLWNSASKVGANPVYGAQSTAWYAANGSPDITALFVAGCRARGLKVGIYYSIWDTTWEVQTGTNQDDNAAGYIAMIEAELTELLTNYGTIDSLWFDGWQWHITYADIPYATIYNHVKGIQSNCVVVENSHTFPTATSEILTYEAPTADGSIPAGNLILAEEIDTPRVDDHWYYHPLHDQTSAAFTAAATIKAAIDNANNNNGAYLLAVTPGIDGTLPAALVTRLAEIGAL